MTNISTIEDVLENILGLVLGGAAGQYELATSGSGGGQSNGKSSINDAYRPAAIKGPGFWMIAQTSTLKHTGGWAPEYDKDAVTFYKWVQHGATKEITRLTVWVGVVNRDNTQGQEHNTTDPTTTVNPTANPVIALGSAWELIQNEIPHVAGVGTPFDPNSIEAVREILGNLTVHAMDISGELQDEMAKVNIKNPDFKGSAEAAWYHRVQGANHWLSDIQTQFTRWDGVLYQAEEAAKNFIKALLDANYKWSQLTPVGTWQHPYRVLAAMFNGGTLQYGDLHNGQSDAWNLGTQYANTGDYKDDGNAREGGGSSQTTNTVLWTPPAWANFPAFDAFDISGWSRLDAHLRQMWADNIINTFAPVLTSAAALVKAFADARNPMNITDPDPVPPLPMPNNYGNPNGDNPYANYNPYANWPDNPFANWNNPFANWNNPYANMGGDDPFANWNNPFANWDNPFANYGGNNPFANGDVGNQYGYGGDNPYANGAGGNQFAYTSDNPFANTPLDPTTLYAHPLADTGSDNPFANGDGSSQYGYGGGNPYANDGLDNGYLFSKSANPYGDNSGYSGAGTGPQTLGDLTPKQLQQLDSAGLLDDVPLTPEERAYLNQHGLAVPDDTTTLGQLTPAQLAALQQGGLLDQTPLTDAQRAALGLNTPSSLGDLTPAQLQQLDSAGYLDNVPLTPEEAAYLSQQGMPVADGTTTLGQLTPAQLAALQQGGLLDQTPLTSAELADLGLSNPAQYGGATYVPGLTYPPGYELGPTSPVDTNPFPTTVNGVDVSPLPDPTVPNLPLGDVTQPGSATYPNLPGVQVGTGGLSSVGGLSGSPGALSKSGLGLPISGSDGASSGSGAGSGFNLGGIQTSTGESPYGGMPYMPGMMGGAGQSRQDRERQRNTWLKEDEKVWGTDPECAPAVLGRRGRKTRADDDEYDTPLDERPGSQDERRPYRGR